MNETGFSTAHSNAMLLRRLTALLMLCMTSTHLWSTEEIEHPDKGIQYETLSFRLVRDLHFDNPFDLETNRVELLITRPDSSSCILSFFYDGIDGKGVEQWVARYAPAMAGPHRFRVRINGVVTDDVRLTVEPNQRPRQGGLRIADRPGIFTYASGEPFRGIGLNVCWAREYEYYFRKMRDAGMNVTRIWMCPWNLPLEWERTGLGRYDLGSARKLDEILALAKAYGIYVILCMDFHGMAPKGLGYFKEDRWLANPYNHANGGPCADRAEFFTNEEAKSWSKKKYRYIVSRFGHSAQVLAWEFFNEADLMAGKAIPVNRWHIEMAEYMKSIDIHHRMVSSSSTRQYVEKLVDAFRSPATDFIMFHDYNSPDIAPHFIDLFDACNEYYQKPMVLGEFGVEYRGADLTEKADPHHIGLHNGIWSGWFSETPVIPLSWWWDNYIDPHNLWTEYASLSRFAQSMQADTGRLEFRTLDAGTLVTDPTRQVPCLVRAISSGERCALWLKNLEYRWSSVGKSGDPKSLKPFLEKVPGLPPGRYAATWYDPQTGRFTGIRSESESDPQGTLVLSVPSFSRDLACMIIRLP